MLLAAGHEITSQIYSSLIATVGFSTWALHWIVGQYKWYLRDTILHCTTCLVPFDLSPVCRNFQLAYNVGEQTKIPKWNFSEFDCGTSKYNSYLLRKIECEKTWRLTYFYTRLYFVDSTKAVSRSNTDGGYKGSCEIVTLDFGQRADG